MTTDRLLAEITEYVLEPPPFSDLAFETVRLSLLDALGCATLAASVPECARLLGPVVPGATVPDGVPVPATSHALDPVQAAFAIGTAVRWLDYNDTWLAAEWGHPSDNFGAILAAAAYASRSVQDVLTAAIQAYEIQGVLALTTSLNRVGLDHVLLVRVASAAVATRLLGGDADQVLAAVSNAWVDGGSLRVYRQAPNVGSRKAWAAGDATSRGVRLALLALAGQAGYPTCLSAPEYGFEHVLFADTAIRLARPLGSYVAEHVLFKVAYPVEFHAQTALEAAIRLHPLVRDHLSQVAHIEITTQESARRIIDKAGPLRNPADRDHCLQYIVAVGLLFGTLTADHYTDAAALDPRIDGLRGRMSVREHPRYSADYLDPEKRSIANAVQVLFADGTATPRIEIEYPLGHPRRRAEALPVLLDKLERNLLSGLPAERVSQVLDLGLDHERLCATSARSLLQLLSTA